MIVDTAGNLYGTTVNGGTSGNGTVYKLTPPATGETAWTKTVLHSFDGTDGSLPVSGLIADSAGSLYGTTIYGGAYQKGTVFKLTPPAKGQTAWTETRLVSFNGNNGGSPNGNLIADAAGNFYGTTESYGAYSVGTVFKLAPPAKGEDSWTVTVLHSFVGGDGQAPTAGLVADGAGNLYGTTYSGGAKQVGLVFKLIPPANGQSTWTEDILFQFNGSDGSGPAGGLLADTAGHLYGTTRSGGVTSTNCGQDEHPLSCGTVFKLNPPAKGTTTWTETILNEFGPSASVAGLIADKSGNLFGTAYPLSPYHSDGAVFELTPPASAGRPTWTRSVLTYFNGTNGSYPYDGLIADKAGNLYGTTSSGGKYGYGTVFKLTR